MKRRAGSILLSVMAFLTIFAGFESFRYHNFVQRQAMYHYLLVDYRKPVVSLPVPESANQAKTDSKFTSKLPATAKSTADPKPKV